MKISVTDHALIRWLERVHGLDMEGLRTKLRELVEARAVAGATAVKLDGARYYIADGTLVTVRTDRPQKLKKTRQEARDEARAAEARAG